MSNYCLIESRDPFDSADAASCQRMAAELARAGHHVQLFLVQNGVLSARRGAQGTGLGTLTAAGVEILADEFSLRERGIASDALATGVHAAPLDTVLKALTSGAKTLWH